MNFVVKSLDFVTKKVVAQSRCILDQILIFGIPSLPFKLWCKIPSSLSLFISLAAWLDGLTQSPHVVLRQVFLKLSKEEDDLLIPGYVILLLLEPPQIVLQHNTRLLMIGN